MKSLVPVVALVCCFFSTLAEASNTTSAHQTTLVLLGTHGGPGGDRERAGIASLLTVHGKHYLIDAGEGVSRQVAAAGLSERDISTVFLTHLHDDHTAGLPALMTFFYTLRGGNMQLIGPPGTQELYDGVLAYMKPNTEIRSVENGRNVPLTSIFSVKEVEPGVIYSDDNVKVEAIENTHYQLNAAQLSPQHRSYALKFTTPDKVLVFTGDTGVSKALESFAQNADILVSEMTTATDLNSLPSSVRAHMLEEHLSPTQVGQLASKAHVGKLILSHIRYVGRRDVAEIRRYYSGPIVVGQDLARF